MYSNSYPTFDEIKDDLTKEDLLDIFGVAMTSNGGDINTAIQDYIEAEYEPSKVIDYDYSHNSYNDNLATA